MIDLADRVAAEIKHAWTHRLIGVSLDAIAEIVRHALPAVNADDEVMLWRCGGKVHWICECKAKEIEVLRAEIAHLRQRPGFCTREANHHGPCNGLQSSRCRQFLAQPGADPEKESAD